jgi:formamidopyrimidine-DNA glycosylase
MPELPEVETVRRSLEPAIVGRTIVSAEILHRDVLLNETGLPLTGWKITRLRRRGKYLLIDANGADTADQTHTVTIVVHLRMTGQLLLDETGSLNRDHVHVRFGLADNDGNSLIYLLFRDVRRFGRVWYFPGGHEAMQPGLAALGPEPLGDGWTIPGFKAALKRRTKTNIKSVLLDQHVVAGLGNIYVDEALFRAGISPLRLAAGLSGKQIKELYNAVRTVLEQAIGHRGTSFRDYVDGLNTKGHFQYELKVYGRAGQPCSVCGRPIIKRRVAGRGTCSCSYCQPDPEN